MDEENNNAAKEIKKGLSKVIKISIVVAILFVFCLTIFAGAITILKVKKR